jgi:hypothetical protein
MAFNIGFGWVPALTGTITLGGVLGLLIAWIEEGRPQYQPNEASIVYISDVGAHLKTPFIGLIISVQS